MSGDYINDVGNPKDRVPSEMTLSAALSSVPSSSPNTAPRAHLRLASAHPLLSMRVTFWNVPHIEDETSINWGISRSSTVTDVVDGISELFRLSLQSVEYIVESATTEDNGVVSE